VASLCKNIQGRNSARDSGKTERRRLEISVVEKVWHNNCERECVGMDEMEAAAAAEATDKPGVVKDGLDNPAREARRRRMEIRRLKVIAHAATGEERYRKRRRPLASARTALTFDDASSPQGSSLTCGLNSVCEKNDGSIETVVSETAIACLGIGLIGTGSTGENTSGLDGLCSKSGFGLEEHAVRWGYASICGRRREMEDAVTAVPGFLSVASETVGDSESSTGKSPLHLFGVYDGHGGSQVANFCKERLHGALIEELEAEMKDGDRGGGECSWQRQWERAFVACFNKVDAEIGGVKPRNLRCGNGEEVGGRGNDESARADPAPTPADAVGSTAVVAVVGSSQIIVSNCGDSRVVLSRGGHAIALSVDHKPERDDEMTRIEAAGGRVIQWNGYRVFGVLAMSRAIGDHYLKPYLISDPEVTFTQRTDEDECLILASDGLWDVLSNEEVCEITRRCLAKWLHNNNIAATSSSSSKSKSWRERREEEMDPCMQAVAGYLSKMAFLRGSSDNITVVVVDLRKETPQT
jgi:serine/threonine protein phosphatase PrpC